MTETSKASAHATRQQIYAKYVCPPIIDIGCGEDKLKIEGASVRGFDRENGDAQSISHQNHPLDHYYTIYSSHCLEHMADVPAALKNWSLFLRQGGHMIIIVPDFVMYEHRTWPSRFNSDHKASFSIFDVPADERHPTFYSTGQMIQMGRAAGLELVDLFCEAHGYDWHLVNYLLDQTQGNACANVVYVFRKQ